MKNDVVHIFDAKEIACDLKEIAVEIMQNDEGDIESRWFHSAKDADVFIWKNKNKKLVKHQIAFLGQVVDWDENEGLRTGVIIDDESDREAPNSPLIKYDASLQKQTVLQCIEIIVYMPTLAAEDKRQLLSCYGHAPGININHIIRRLSDQDTSLLQSKSLLNLTLKFLGLSFKKK